MDDMAIQVPEMVTVADIQFKTGGKNYSFDPGELTLEPGQEVIIDTQRGLEFGICQRGNHGVLASQVVQPLRPVVRLATDEDRRRLKDNEEKETQAFDTCQRCIERLRLDMKLVRVEYAFDGSKLLFFFTSDGRVDFRELVKELAAIYRTRIEMRQIGVRDEAKLLGGLGICGRPFCCNQFLDDFQPVSIKMAKTQSLSLNPTKISGTCGRLMCCLKYEQEAYEDLIRNCPKQGSLVDTVDGRGTVLDVSLLRQQVKVGLEDAPDTVKYYRNDEIAVLRDGKGKKTDAPIPRDVAPISGDPARRAQLQASKQQQEQQEQDDALNSWIDFSAAYDNTADQPDAPAGDKPQDERRRQRRRRPAKAEGRPEGRPEPRPEGRTEKPAARAENQPEGREAKPAARAENQPEGREAKPAGRPNRRRLDRPARRDDGAPRPAGERPNGDRPNAERSAGDRPVGDRPANRRSRRGHRGGRPSGPRPGGSAPQTPPAPPASRE